MDVANMQIPTQGLGVNTDYKGLIVNLGISINRLDHDLRILISQSVQWHRVNNFTCKKP